MQNLVTHLFVYGSLRQGFKSDAYQYISQYFTFVANATVAGKLVHNGNYPLGVTSNNGEKIIGELYCITNTANYEWAYAQLDDYEGVIVEANETPAYIKATATAYYNNTEVQCILYWYNGNTDGMAVIPSGDVFDFYK